MDDQVIAWRIFEQMDSLRRLQGQVMDALGMGCAESGYRVAFSEPGMSLRAYADRTRTGPVLLIVPAPIKRPYIWDLAPGASVVQQLLRDGLRVYLLSWEPPGDAGAQFSLADYADRLILRSADAVARETGEGRMLVAGHSLGGTFAAIFAALHPERVQGLVLLGSPLRFGGDTGKFVNLVAAQAVPGAAATTASGIPGSYLSTLSYMASPETFGWARWLDWLRSLPDREALQTHLRVTRWTLDESPLPGRLFHEVAEQLCREDRFMRGTLEVGGRRAAAAGIETPCLAVADPRCDIVPPAAILPFLDAIAADEKRLLWYEGDIGVALQHVGMLVGENAHRRLWPEISRWLRDAWSRRAPSPA